MKRLLLVVVLNINVFTMQATQRNYQNEQKQALADYHAANAAQNKAAHLVIKAADNQQESIQARKQLDSADTAIQHALQLYIDAWDAERNSPQKPIAKSADLAIQQALQAIDAQEAERISTENLIRSLHTSKTKCCLQ